MKRIFATILAALMSLSAITAVPAVAEEIADGEWIAGGETGTGEEPSPDNPDFPDFPDFPEFPDFPDENLVVSGDWIYEPVDGTAVISGYIGEETNLTVPSELDGLPVTEIGMYAFLGCETIVSITIPDSVTRIGDGAFSYVETLESITLPDTLTSIGSYAFDATAYASLLGNWTDGALYIGNYLVALEEAYVGELTVADGTVLIADQLFYAQDSIEAISLPASLRSVGLNFFEQCYSLRSITVDGGNEFYASVDGVLFDKDVATLIKCPSHIEKVTIPESITSIGEYAFTECSLITEIAVPEGVTELAEGVFSQCGSLESVTLPDSLTYIGVSAFTMCDALTDVVIPKNVGRIDAEAFTLCSALENISIPAGVEEIGANAFTGCTALAEINVDGANEIYSSVGGVLYSKDGTVLITCPGARTELTVPEGVTGIADFALSCCVSLESVTLPASLTSIGCDAFGMCAGLKTVVIPEGVTEIGEGAFAFCAGLTQVTLPDSLTNLGPAAFSFCTALSSVRLPSNLVEIKDGLFTACASLKSIVIPKSVVSIGMMAFAETGLKTVYYGGSEEDWKNVMIAEGSSEIMKSRIEYNFIPGDVNGDGKLNARDITAIMRFLLNNADPDFSEQAADFNIDGNINARDISGIMNELLKK